MTFQLRASGAHRWVRCSAAPAFGAGVDETTSDAAREGTCAAWVAERVIKEGLEPADMLGQMHPNGWTVDAEMVWHVGQYIEEISMGGTIETECEVSIWNGLVVGHFDARELFNGRLYINDLKYGHDVVEVEDNWQLIAYALGSWELPWYWVTVGIYQPRAAHPDGRWRTQTYTRAELEPLAATLYAAAQEAQKPNAIATPGRHCSHCPAAARCDALARSCYVLHDVVRSRVTFEMDNAQLGAELDFLDYAATLLSARKNAIEAEAEAKISGGKFVPGWEMRPGHGQRRWKYPPEVIALVTGKSLVKTSTKSPAELEREAVDVSALAESTTTKPKLKRVNERDIARVFTRKES